MSWFCPALGVRALTHPPSDLGLIAGFAIERMNEILFHYQRVNPTTWAYLSSLLMLGLFFKFNRFWSVRNLDLVLLILLAPGLLMVHYGQETRQTAQKWSESYVAPVEPGETAAKSDATPPPAASPSATRGVETSPAVAPPENAPEATAGDGSGNKKSSTMYDPTPDLATLSPPADPRPPELTPAQSLALDGIRLERGGYVWLFITGGLLLVRLLLDVTMVRRPLLEPNLSTGGLAFLGCSLFVFLMANVITSAPTLAQSSASGKPGYALFQSLPAIETVELNDPKFLANVTMSPPVTLTPPPLSKPHANSALSKTIVILAHLAIVIAMVGIGYRHFDNIKMGIGAATLYLLLPYSAQMTGLAEHVVPAAFLLWGVFFYRRPLTAGLFMGLAAGVGYYPLFLLPLWISFYWQRGLLRFNSGVASGLLVMAASLAFQSSSLGEYVWRVREMVGALPFRMTGLGGLWALGWDPFFRVPMLTAFLAVAGSFALWPAQKNLGTLLSCSAAIMLAAQFWHGGSVGADGLGLDGGGMYMAWYLPLLILTVFRPNLEDRVALTVLGDGWFPRRRLTVAKLDRAA